MHATSNLSETLGNVRRLLRPEGLLILVEVTRRLRWLDLVFGLLDGWWRFQDVERRPSHALLPTCAWFDLLRETGFAEVASLSDEQAS